VNNYFLPSTAVMLGKPLSKKKGELIAYLKRGMTASPTPHFPQIIPNAEEVGMAGGGNGYDFPSDHH
jgi:hypothetical protein